MIHQINTSATMLRASAEAIEANPDLLHHEVGHVRNALEPLRFTFIGLRARLFFEYEHDATMDGYEHDHLAHMVVQQMRDMATRLDMIQSV